MGNRKPWAARWLLAAAFGLLPIAATAHPLGNFTSNHLTRLSAGERELRARYVLDDAEIPTFALLRALDPAGRPSAAVLGAWAALHATVIAPALELTVDGRPANWIVRAGSATLRPGAGGLPTLYATAELSAPLTPGPHRIVFRDGTLPGKIGWKDVVVGAAADPTDELRRYPDALLGSPRARTAVTVAFDGAGGLRALDDAAAPRSAAPPSVARMDGFAAVLERDLRTPLAFALALLLAAGLGALHALEPGHGKTLLAVTLVGARATAGQALTLAATLTIAHTIGVVALGVACLALTRYVVPEAMYPWIACASGLAMLALGVRALLRLRAPSAHAHHHHHDHDHDHNHDHHHHHAHPLPGSTPIRFREALAVAATGNLAPCPAALVVLLAAVASHRVGIGLALIVAFGVGLALTLTAIGMLVVRSAAWLERVPRLAPLARFGPALSAAAIVAIGSWTLAHGAASAGVLPPSLPTIARGDRP
jgi:ABC-type nickel/cobalt efflux system permease component RcnA